MASALASHAIARLDLALRKTGEYIVLRRIVGTASQVNVDVRCRAVVRAFKASELIVGVTQTDSKVVLSPTEIARTQWPGGQRDVRGDVHRSNPHLPRAGDKAIIQGKLRNISFVKPILVDGELVRIELTVAG